MSDITVTIETISALVPMPNADKLEIAKILGTQTVVPKGQFKAGQLVVYFPPDICLPPEVSKSLGVDKYLKSAIFDGQRIPCRVAACRLRGTPSYGFVTEVPAVPIEWTDHSMVGRDVTGYYRAVKYEPPIRVHRQPGGGTGEVWGDIEREPINFHQYTDIQAFWKYHRAFTSGQLVRVTEKVHGTNSRAGLLRVDDEWRFYAGSHTLARKQFEPDRAAVDPADPLKSIIIAPHPVHLLASLHVARRHGPAHGTLYRHRQHQGRANQ